MTPSPDKLEIPEAAVEHMVQRFLGWKLPENFSPDAGIGFKADYNENSAHPMKHAPVGTNLFDATQAEAMVRYMLDGLPHIPDRGYAEGIEAALKIVHATAERMTGCSIDYAAEFIENRLRALAPPAPAETNDKPATHDEESILDVISGNLRMESWVAGKTLTVMFDTESGERRFAKLRLTNIAAQPSPADLKGEPE